MDGLTEIASLAWPGVTKKKGDKEVSKPPLGGLCAIASVAALSLIAAKPVYAAGTATYLGQASGSTPYQATITAGISGAQLSYVAYSITPIQGSLTRPLNVTLYASYLNAHAMLQGGRLNIPVYGLYSLPTGPYNNTVNMTFGYTDGSTSSLTQTVTTSYVQDTSCDNIHIFQSGHYVHSYRKSTQDLSFDYILLKDSCSANSPVILDTDGYVRWKNPVTNTSIANHAGVTATNVVINKAIYASDGTTKINIIDILTGSQTGSTDFSAFYPNQAHNYPINYTNDHNVDVNVAKGTILVGVNTAQDEGSIILELDPSLNVVNYFNMADIISAAITAGGGDPSTFVFRGPDSNGKPQDWFHQNAATYSTMDNTMVISSRENFVIAVDYNAPADGSARKIHWILGSPTDPDGSTKAWYNVPALRKFALRPSSASDHYPIGQHAVSFDIYGHLLLMNDGYGATFHKTPVNPETVSVLSTVFNYAIDLSQSNATSPGVFSNQFGYGSFGSNNTTFASAVCGSAYLSARNDPNYGLLQNYLMDFAFNQYYRTSNPYVTPNPPGPAVAFNSQATLNAELQGLRTDDTLVFDMEIPEYYDNCGAGWNAVPMDLSNVVYQ